MLNKQNYKGMKFFVRLYIKQKGGTCEQLSQFNMVVTNKICICREQTDFENVTNFVDIEFAVQYRNAVSNFIYL